MKKTYQDFHENIIEYEYIKEHIPLQERNTFKNEITKLNERLEIQPINLNEVAELIGRTAWSIDEEETIYHFQELLNIHGFNPNFCTIQIASDNFWSDRDTYLARKEKLPEPLSQRVVNIINNELIFENRSCEESFYYKLTKHIHSKENNDLLIKAVTVGEYENSFFVNYIQKGNHKLITGKPIRKFTVEEIVVKETKDTSLYQKLCSRNTTKEYQVHFDAPSGNHWWGGTAYKTLESLEEARNIAKNEAIKTGKYISQLLEIPLHNNIDSKIKD